DAVRPRNLRRGRRRLAARMHREVLEPVPRRQPLRPGELRARRGKRPQHVAVRPDARRRRLRDRVALLLRDLFELVPGIDAQPEAGETLADRLHLVVPPRPVLRIANCLRVHDAVQFQVRVAAEGEDAVGVIAAEEMPAVVEAERALEPQTVRAVEQVRRRDREVIEMNRHRHVPPVARYRYQTRRRESRRYSGRSNRSFSSSARPAPVYTKYLPSTV